MPEEITLDEATAALQQLAAPEGAVESEAVPAEPVAPVAAPVETPPQEIVEETVTDAPVAEDDLASLKSRNEELESGRTEFEERHSKRLEALQDRHKASEQILRDQYLRKSTVADRALKVLRATRSEGGVSENDVDTAIREMEGTMHPSSASYVAPEPQPAATEDQSLVLNSFLNEHGMTADEAETFGRWMATEAQTAMSPAEQAVAKDSLDGFLRLAHVRWQGGVKAKEAEAERSDAVGAVKSVQRTQRAAARAASSPTTAPKKQLAGAVATKPTSELTSDEVSALLRQSVEQYK